MSTTVEFAPAPTIPTAAPVSAPAAFSASQGTSSASPIHIPLGAWIAVAVVLLYVAWAFAGANVAPAAWNYLHEFFHDGRHFLGIPCH